MFQNTALKNNMQTNKQKQLIYNIIQLALIFIIKKSPLTAAVWATQAPGSIGLTGSALGKVRYPFADEVPDSAQHWKSKCYESNLFL